MPKELAKQYAPQGTEDRIYQNWCDKGYFHTQIDRSKKPFTIVMPPPNVTGQLHMGHAMDETWQDILTRYKRMQGYAALWVPGTDHASIATEAKVVAKMREEGLTKEMVGRDGFLERAWDWKNTYGNRIVSQLKKLGCSCDWQRERFTMDEGCSDAVKEVFVRLYNEGLIYRGNRMVNWCPHCNTSISDAEVEYEAKEGSFWHLLYPVKETGEMLELIHSGVNNIICTQPFGCLPNHIVGKGVIKELRRNYPLSNIIAVDYDPGASEVNQLNRIKLMLATAQKNLKTESSREDRGNGRRPMAAYSPCLGTMSHT